MRHGLWGFSCHVFLGKMAIVVAVIGAISFPLGEAGHNDGGLWADGPGWIGATGWLAFLLCLLLLVATSHQHRRDEA